MKRKLLITATLFLSVFYPLQNLQAQSKEDSLAFVSAEWNWQELGKGALAGNARISIFGSIQNISIVKYPAKKFRTGIMNFPGAEAGPTDSLAMKSKASIAINGSYFNTRTICPHTFLSIGHKVQGESPADELQRSNGILAFKDRKGRKIDIFPCDSTEYESYRKEYYSAIAAGPLLLSDGKEAFIDTDSKFNSDRHPRSIMGYDRNGYYHMIVIDGRFPGQADGITIKEAAAIAIYAGLYEAINLDGGGSSTLWTEPTGVINHPSDNKRFDHSGCRTVPTIIIAR